MLFILIFYFIYIILFYFILFYFILFYFLPFLLCCEADGVLVLWLSVRTEPTRWESRVQDIGPPETPQLHIISIGESSPRDRLNTKTQLHQTVSKLQCWMPNTKQPARQEHKPTHYHIGCLSPTKFTDTPKRMIGHGPVHQKEKIQSLQPEHRHQSPPPGSLHKPLNQPHPLERDTKNNGNYEPAAYKKETPNTVN